jgi:predicted RNA-binding protein with PIN domain
MRYLIDGYNLMHALGLVPPQVGPQGLEPARKRFLQLLTTLLPARGEQFIVVFDGLHAPPDASDVGAYQGIKYVYSRGQNADDLIEDLLAREDRPHHLTLVTDDRRLQQAARHRSCQVSGCLDFIDKVKQSSAQPPAEERLPEPARDALTQEEVERWLREFGFDDEDDEVPW